MNNMNFIKSLFKVFLNLGLYFIIIVIATAIMYFGIDKLRWFWLLHPTIITQGILIGKIIYRHHSNLSTNLAFLGVFASIIALVINHQYINIFVYMKNWPILGTGSILFSIAFAYAFSIENYEHWKMFLLNKINPIQKRVKDDGIPLGKEMIEKSKPIYPKL